MSGRRRVFLWLSLCAGTVAIAIGAQESSPPQSPTFRAGANFVRVDMYPTQDARFVEDLKPEEIELREDGVVQHLESFERVRIAPSTAPTSRPDPNTVADSREAAADARSRVFVIFLDTMNTQMEGAANMRQPLARFLDRVLGPDDLVAVMTPDMSGKDLTFGRKTTLLANVLRENWNWGTRGNTDADAKERLYNACYPPLDAGGRPDDTAAEMRGRRRERLTLDALDDLVTVLGGLREERKAVLTISEGWVLYRENRALAAAQRDRDGNPVLPPPGVFGPNPRRRVEGGGQPQTQVNASSRAECDADRLALALMDNTRRLQQLTDRANRGNVSFYSVYARRMAVFDAPAGPDRGPTSATQDRTNLGARQDSLRVLADNTDGLAIVNTTAIDAGIDRIVSDLSSYYLLGYYSTNTRLDGKYRTISVRVTRPRVEVRARRGYRGLTADDILSRTTAAEKSAAVKPAKALGGVNADERAAFRIRASPWRAPSTDSTSTARMWIVGELEYRLRRDPAWSSGARAEVMVVGADGTTVMTKTIEVAAADGTFAVQVPERGSVAAGEYAVRVSVSPRSGSASALSDTARVAVAEQAAPIGEAVMWRRGPQTGTRYAMTADPRFMRTERLRLELPTQTTAPAMAKLMDRTGRTMAIPVQVSERAGPGSDYRWIVADLTLAPLATGDYAIEVSVDGSTRLTEFRVVP